MGAVRKGKKPLHVKQFETSVVKGFVSVSCLTCALIVMQDESKTIEVEQVNRYGNYSS